MIKVEQTFDTVFDGLEIPNNDDLFFHYGNQKELDRIIVRREKARQRNYPLFWYLMPNSLNVRQGLYAEGNCKFVLAHNTEDELFNDQRFDQVYNGVLNPCFDAIYTAIGKSGSIEVLKLSSGFDYEYTNYPNYGTPSDFEGNAQAKQTNYWDAIGITMNLRIHAENKC